MATKKKKWPFDLGEEPTIPGYLGKENQKEFSSDSSFRKLQDAAQTTEAVRPSAARPWRSIPNQRSAPRFFGTLLIQTPPQLALLCLTLILAGACGDLDDDDGGSSQGGGGSGGDGGSDGGGGSGGGGDQEDPWHCASKTWSAVLSDEGVYSIRTDHYQLELEVETKERAEELGRMAEATWLALTSYFDSYPALDTSQRLSVSFFMNQDRFQAAMAAIGAHVPDAGGYYSPGTRTAYLYDQPTRYYTNILYVHEMTHQFHLLARTGNKNRPSWYVEGLAEYLGRHDWDGNCIRLGVIPTLSLEDYPKRALDSVSISGLDTSSIISGSKEASRAESWAIIGFLERGEGGANANAFATYRALMDAGSAGTSAFEELLGPISSFSQRMTEWLPTAQEPLTPIFIDWVHVSPGTVRSERRRWVSLARVKDPHSEFRITTTEQSIDARTGVLTGFTDRDNYVAYLIGSDSNILKFEVIDGVAKWHTVGPSVSPNKDGSFTWTVSHSGTETQVEVNGVSQRAASGFQPASGPAAYDFDGIFSDMKWH